jgi:hypothetical protein
MDSILEKNINYKTVENIEDCEIGDDLQISPNINEEFKSLHLVSDNEEIYENEITEDEIEYIETNNKKYITNKNSQLFTSVLNINNEIKFQKEYNKWLNQNYNELQSMFYILDKKYLCSMKLQRNITFREFTEFCFLSL